MLIKGSAKGTMRILKLHSYLSLAALLIAAGCAHRTHTESQTEPAGARLTAAAAIRIADQAAERDGRHLGDYKSPTPRFDAGDKSWSVFFDGRVPEVGNQFWVLINDQTGETQLRRGR